MIHVDVTLKGRVIATRECAGPRVRVGRASTNEVVLDAADVEAGHCALERRLDGTWRLVVFALVDGTRLNGQRVQGEVAIKEGDVVGVGAFELTFRWVERARDGTPGQRIGRYEVTGALGAGGMGVVLRARDPRLRRDVAIKLLKKGRDASEQSKRRFEREANVLARLSHPHILNVFDVGEHEGEPYLVMELIGGESLDDRLLRDGRLPLESALRITEEVARALHYMHQQGALHRDVKPGNILLRAPDDHALLTDFGLAKDFTQTFGLTAPGATLGTMGFCPPEQLENAANVTAQADVFAAGATLYASLTGRSPYFKAMQTTRSALLAVLNERWTPLRELRRDVPAEVEAVITWCLKARPAERYPDALALADDVARLRRREPPLGVAPKPVGGVVAAMDALMSADLDDDRTPPAAARPGAPSPAPVPEPARAPTVSRVAPPAGASTADTVEADACVERARERFAAGDALAAIDALDRALALAPGRAGLWSMRAVARRRRGDHRGALADQDEALRLDPDDLGARVGRGLIRVRARDHLRAAEDFEHALECLPPDSPRRPRIEAMLERALGTLGDTVVRGFRLRRPSGMGEVDPPKPQ